MKRGGIPIRDVLLRHGVNPNITYSQVFLEWEAATAAGLSLWDWDNGVYDRLFQAKVIAWYNLHILVAAHASDAAIKK